MYNLISDAAAAILIARNSENNRIVHFHQQAQPYYWNTPLHENELIAAYFPTARNVILEALRRSGLGLPDVDWIVPHNVSWRSWELLAGVLQFPTHKIYGRNIARRGHSIAADNLINLKDMEAEGLLRTGQRLLLFNFGFGAHWSTLILEH